MTDGAIDEVNEALADKERMNWLSADRERLRYVQSFLETVENDDDLRGVIDRLMTWSEKDLREGFAVHQDRRMRR